MNTSDQPEYVNFDITVQKGDGPGRYWVTAACPLAGQTVKPEEVTMPAEWPTATQLARWNLLTTSELE